MDLLITLYLFAVGTAFGSFALAMVDRMKSGKDWVNGRSECDNCKHKLRPVDLFPIFSWLSTWGKCRYCGVKLSIAYPLVEMMTGLAIAISYWFSPYIISGANIAVFALWLIALVLMSALVVFDLRWFKLPSKIVYPLVAVAFIQRIIVIITNGESIAGGLVSVLLSLLVGFGLFFILYIVSSGKWIGDGDVRLGLAIGLFLSGPVEAWMAIFIASILGLLLSLFTVKKGKKVLKTKIPFGPMLIGGTFIVYVFGSRLIDWYSSTFFYF